MKVYQAIANTIQANRDNTGFSEIEFLEGNFLPSGNGFNDDSWIDIGMSNEDKIVIHTAYHCMDENGYYDGWIDPITITVTPSFDGINLKINWHGYRGKYKELLQDYIFDEFYNALEIEVIGRWNLDTKTMEYSEVNKGIL